MASGPTPAEPYPRCRHDEFEERVLSNPYPALFEEVFSWSTISSDLKSYDFSVWVLEE
jgi:hypothetical protein